MKGQYILALALEWLEWLTNHENEGCTSGQLGTGTPRRVRNASGQQTTTTAQR